jgi:hypothetical protein
VLRGRSRVLLIGIVAIVATACSSGSNKSAPPPVQSKLVPVSQIRRANVVVVPANAEVQEALDGSPTVDSYARITDLKADNSVRCAVAAGGFVVQQGSVGVDIATPLAQTLGAQLNARVHDLKQPEADGHIQFAPGANTDNINAVRAALAADPLDVSGYREGQRSFDFNVRKAATLKQLQRRFASFAGVNAVTIHPDESPLLTAKNQSPPTNCPTP